MGRLDKSGFVDREVRAIGAGLSTLIYCWELIEKHNVPASQMAVSEAQEIGGGRIKTIEHGGQIFEAGAQWFHGGEKGVPYQWLKANLEGELVKRLGVEKFDDIFVRDDLSNVPLIDKSGQFILHPLFQMAGKEVSFRKAGWHEANALYQKLKIENHGGDVSFKDMMERGNELAREFLRLKASTWMAAKPYKISGDEFFAEPAGSGGLQVKGGMSRITNVLQDILREKGVKFDFEHVVVAISQLEGGNYELMCKTPKGLRPVYAKAVYSSLPAAVLQSDLIELNFDVPKKVWRSINSLHAANLRKQFLPFPKGFFAGMENFAPNTRYDNLDRRLGKQPVWAHCYGAGEDGIYIAGRNKGIATGGLAFSMLVLDRIPQFQGFADHLTAPPLGKDWGENPYSLGAYSCRKLGAERPDHVMQINNASFVFGGTDFVRDEDGASTTDGAIVAGQQGAAYTAAFLQGKELTAKPKRRKETGYSYATARPEYGIEARL